MIKEKEIAELLGVPASTPPQDLDALIAYLQVLGTALK